MELKFSTGFFFGLGVMTAVAVAQLASLAATYGIATFLAR